MKQLTYFLSIIGAVMILFGASVYITKWIYAPYLFCVGSVFFALGQMGGFIKEEDYILRRLRIQQMLGAFAIILSGVFMFILEGNEWIVCLTIGAILELYTAFRIPQEENKREK